MEGEKRIKTVPNRITRDIPSEEQVGIRLLVELQDDPTILYSVTGRKTKRKEV